MIIVLHLFMQSCDILSKLCKKLMFGCSKYIYFDQYKLIILYLPEDKHQYPIK
jgi:hypothetical protein